MPNPLPITSLSQLSGGQPNFTDESGQKIRLEGAQAAATLNPSVRRNYPAFAVANEYHNMSPENTIPYQLGSGLHDIFTRPNFMGRILDQGPLVGAAALGGLGAAAGYGLSALAHHDGSAEDRKKRRRAALLAGLTGAAAGAYSGSWRTKAAAWLAGRSNNDMEADARRMIVRMLMDAPNLTFRDRQSLSEGVMGLSDSQARNLLEMIGPMGGFAIGAIVARFLLHAGSVGTLFGAMAGAALGNALQPSRPTDGMGRPSLNHRDLFGNPLT